MSQVVKS